MDLFFQKLVTILPDYETRAAFTVNSATVFYLDVVTACQMFILKSRIEQGFISNINYHYILMHGDA